MGFFFLMLFSAWARKEENIAVLIMRTSPSKEQPRYDLPSHHALLHRVLRKRLCCYFLPILTAASSPVRTPRSALQIGKLRHRALLQLAWDRLLECLLFLALNNIKDAFVITNDYWRSVADQGWKPAHCLSRPSQSLSPRDVHNYWAYNKPAVAELHVLCRIHWHASI